MPENPTADFRAPPPSPVAANRRSCFTNEDVLADFLENSLRVPDLVLPDKIFPQQKFSDTPPAIDFGSLDSSSFERVLESIEKIGCFQLVNCGIPGEVVSSAVVDAAGMFMMSPEERTAAKRSPENLYGFEVLGDEESELSEEFVWRGGELEEVVAVGNSNFREKMEALGISIERVAKKIFRIFRENSMKIRETYGNDGHQIEEAKGVICCVYKHRKIIGDEDQWLRSLKYDVMRVLIRGCDHSHALSFHVCDGFSEFHVYSKRGWLSFSPHEGAILVTIGDQIQAMSGGKYKQVMGRAIYKGGEKCISMAFLYSPPSNAKVNTTMEVKSEKTISVGQQAMIGLLLTIAYQFLVFICNKF